jgi:putative transcriptional regulator
MSLAPAITVSAHLDSCADCRAHVMRFEEAEGVLMETTPPLAMSDDALPNLLRLIEQGDWSSEPAIGAEELADIRLPSAIVRAGLGPRRWLAPGFWAAPVRASSTDDWRTYVLRIPAGAVIPTHGHHGGELVAVLTGAFHDGRRYEAGDFAENVAGSDHHLRIDGAGPCACVISIQGRLQWRGWSRMIRPLLGI